MGARADSGWVDHTTVYQASRKYRHAPPRERDGRGNTRVRVMLPERPV